MVKLLVAILVLTLGLTVGCTKSKPAPIMPSTSPGVTKDWQSYDNESLGITFRYPDTYTLLLDDPINSGIQLESESIYLAMSANPFSKRSVDMHADDLHSKGFKESQRIHIQKGSWKGLRLKGKVTQIGLPSIDEVVYMVKAPSGSIFSILAISTVASPVFAEVDIIWDSLVLRRDNFAIPPSLLGKTPMATLQPKGQGYSLRYPQRWQAIAMSEGLIFVHDPDDPDAFAMSIRKIQPTEANVDKATEHALALLAVFDDVVLLSKNKVSLSGAQDAVMLVGSARFRDGGPVVFRTLLVLTKTSTYKVEVVAKTAKWKSLSPIFDEIFDSFAIDIQ